MSIASKIGIAALLTGLTMGSAQAVVEVEWWHPFSSSKGKIVDELVDNFNAANKDILIKSVHKGGYAETLNAGIAAYRGGNPPGILLALGRDASTMMTSGAVYPVHKLLKDNGISVNWNRFIPGAMAMFSDNEGAVSLPFNSSTPLFWYNVDIFEKNGIKSAPKTWDEVGAVAKKLKAAGVDCTLTGGWPNWVHMESYSLMHEIEVVSNGNGMDSWDAKLVFNKQPMYVKHMNRLKKWVDEGLYTYAGRTGGKAREAFASGKCAMSLQSSSAFAKVKKKAKFRFSASFLPYESGTSDPKNSAVGGGSLFVMTGHSKEVNAAIAKFMDYLTKVPQQTLWHKKTGYAPISLDAYDAVKASGYYETYPHQELAILQMMRGGKPGLLNRGLRIGYASQVYTVLAEELERVWAGEKTVQAALDNASQRGEKIIGRFVKTIGQ